MEDETPRPTKAISFVAVDALGDSGAAKHAARGSAGGGLLYATQRVTSDRCAITTVVPVTTAAAAVAAMVKPTLTATTSRRRW